jgi:hypothetical protein
VFSQYKFLLQEGGRSELRASRTYESSRNIGFEHGRLIYIRERSGMCQRLLEETAQTYRAAAG